MSNREQLILNHLQTVDKCGFNELLNALVKHANRLNLRIAIDRLKAMDLVYEEKVSVGKTELIILKENLDKFLDQLIFLNAEWQIVEEQIKELDQMMKENIFDSKATAFFVTLLVSRAVIITQRIFFIDETVLSEKMKRGLITHSMGRLKKLLDEIERIVKQKSEVSKEFEKVSISVLSDIYAKNFQTFLNSNLSS